MTSFFVAGIPKGQPRVKAFTRGRHAGVYTPKTADEWKAAVRRESSHHCPPTLMQGPIKVLLTFVMPRPKSHFTTKGLRGNAPHFVTTKPDIDNLEKAVLDALGDTGKWWNDDAQVVIVNKDKIYGEATGCTISIVEA